MKKLQKMPSHSDDTERTGDVQALN